PCAHQVACSPALENAAFRGFSERPATLAASAANTGSMPNPPSSAAAAPAVAVAVRMKSRRVAGGSWILSDTVPPEGCFAASGRARPELSDNLERLPAAWQ